MRRRLIFIAVCGAVVGCVLTTDLDGLSGAAAPVDGAVVEAGNDSSSVEEAGPAIDAGTDAPPADFCAGAKFCDRFDDVGRTVQGAWNQFVSGVPTAALVDDAFSPPRAAKFTLEAGDAGGAGSRLILQRTLGADKTVHFEMRLKVTYDAAQFDPSAYDGLFTVLADNTYVFGMSIVPQGFTNGIVTFADADAASGNQNVLLQSGLYSGKWVKFVMDATYAPANGHLRTEIDGNVLTDQNFRSAPTDVTEVIFLLGLSPSGGKLPKVEVIYDDVLYR